MAKRGEGLRDHIVSTAKDVFLELGFERASMDVISARAKTSKRTIYAHFESKEKLYLAVIEYVRRLFLGRLKEPGDYRGNDIEALVTFCGRFLEGLLYAPCIRMCRLTIAEADRFPEGSAQFYSVIFTEAHDRLAAYLNAHVGLGLRESAEAAEDLIGSVIHPRFHRALFGIEKLSDERADEHSMRSDIDVDPIRRAVGDKIGANKPTRAHSVKG